MSAGLFTNSKYNSSETLFIHPIRVQPETITATIATIPNSPPSGDISNPVSAQVSASTRALGLHARKIFAKLAGTPPTGYAAGSKISIPALTESFYTAATNGATMNYLGTTWTVTGRRAEVAR